MIWFHDYFFNLQDLPWPLLTRNGFGKPEIPIVLITVEGNLKINYLWFCLFLTKNFYLKKHFHRLLTGLPQLASHYSGIAISATVAVDAVSPTKIQLRYVSKYVNKYLLSWKYIFDIIDFTNFYYLFLVWKHQDMPMLMEFLKIVFLVSMELIGVKWVY